MESLWQANMDLIGDRPAFDLFWGEGRIHARSEVSAPQVLFPQGEVKDSIISQGCLIKGRVVRSVLSPGVMIEEGATVIDSVVMQNVHVRKGARVEYAILDESVCVAEGAHIGGRRAEGAELTVIGREGSV